MDGEWLVILKMMSTQGLLIAFGLWELWKLRQEKKPRDPVQPVVPVPLPQGGQGKPLPDCLIPKPVVRVRERERERELA